LDGVKLEIRKSAPHQGMFGQTTRDGVIRLFPNAFRSEEELVKTLGTEAQWWDYYQMNQRP
jgi:hypothetical protein